MRIGVFDSPSLQKLERIKAYKKAGFQYYETNFYELYSLSDEEYKAFIEQTRDIGLPLEYTNCLFGSFRIYDENNKISDYSKEYIKRGFERFSNSELRSIAFGSGGSRCTNGAFSVEEAEKMIAEFIQETILPEAKKYGYSFSLEPIATGGNDVITSVQEAADFIEKFGLGGVGILTDYAHLTAKGESLAALEKNKDRLIHTHIWSTTTFGAPDPEDGEEESYIAFINQVKRISNDSLDMTLETWNGFDPEKAFNYLKALTKYKTPSI